MIDLSCDLEVSVKGVLPYQITGMLGFDLAMGFFVLFGPLQSRLLLFGENDTSLSHFGFQGLDSFLEVLQIMPQPNAVDSTRRDNETPFTEFIGGPQTTKGGIFNGQLHHRFFDIRIHPVFQEWFSMGSHLKSLFAAGFIQIFETTVAITGESHDATGFCGVSQLLSQFQ